MQQTTRTARLDRVLRDPIASYAVDAHPRLVQLGLLFDYLLECGQTEAEAAAVLIADYRSTGGRSRLRFESADAELPLPKPKKAKPKA